MHMRQLMDAVFSLESCCNGAVSVRLARVPEGAPSNGGISLHGLPDTDLLWKSASVRQFPDPLRRGTTEQVRKLRLAASARSFPETRQPTSAAAPVSSRPTASRGFRTVTTPSNSSIVSAIESWGGAEFQTALTSAACAEFNLPGDRAFHDAAKRFGVDDNLGGDAEAALRRWFGELKHVPEFANKTELTKVSIGDEAVDVLVLGLDTLALLHRCCLVKCPAGEAHPIPAHQRTARDVSGILDGAAMSVRALKPLYLTLVYAHTALMLKKSLLDENETVNYGDSTPSGMAQVVSFHLTNRVLFYYQVSKKISSVGNKTTMLSTIAALLSCYTSRHCWLLEHVASKYAETVLNIAIEMPSEIASGKRDEWREDSREKELRKVKRRMTYQAKVWKETKRVAKRDPTGAAEVGANPAPPSGAMTRAGDRVDLAVGSMRCGLSAEVSSRSYAADGAAPGTMFLELCKLHVSSSLAAAAPEVFYDRFGDPLPFPGFVAYRVATLTRVANSHFPPRGNMPHFLRELATTHLLKESLHFYWPAQSCLRPQ
jgi:hypothetical protein